MMRRLAACGVPCAYADLTALTYVMHTIDKVILGASALLGNGCVLGAAGTAQTALTNSIVAPSNIVLYARYIMTDRQGDPGRERVARQRLRAGRGRHGADGAH
ncbi:hypothetical protein evm_014516 [Chilo suppressalis]|nr:hypothetical protein evm_014516 [Chilo suppressalis]